MSTEHDLGTAERNGDDVDLAPLFELASESARPREDILGVLLGAAVTLGGGELAVLCMHDGTVLARSPSRVEAEAAGRALAERVAHDGSISSGAEDRETLVIPTGSDPPSALAVRWARGRRARSDVVRSIARACESVLRSPPGAISNRATRDALTGLPSRQATQQHLSDAIHAAARAGGHVGVLFIDLDRFKAVNDVFGHGVGDDALREVAALLQHSARRGDFVGRWGGDEFVAVLNVMSDESEMADAAKRFIDRVVVRVEREGIVQEVGASVGVAVYPEDGAEPESVLDHADRAMYAAKRAGGRTVRWFRDGIGRDLEQQRDLLERLEASDLDRDLIVCYQPIVRASTMDVVAAEALVRWHDPVGGWLAARDFLQTRPVQHLALAVEMRVARSVLGTLRDWGRAGLAIPVHINVGAVDEPTYEALDAVFTHAEDVRGHVAVEVRARVAFADPERAQGFMERLAARGVAVGVDGFGSDPIALHASTLPLRFVKLARALTVAACRDERWRRIASGTIAFAAALGIETYAEGVQNSEQAGWLSANGIDTMQGYFFGQPMTAPDFVEWVSAMRSEAKDAYEMIAMPDRAPP